MFYQKGLGSVENNFHQDPQGLTGSKLINLCGTGRTCQWIGIQNLPVAFSISSLVNNFNLHWGIYSLVFGLTFQVIRLSISCGESRTSIGIHNRAFSGVKSITD